jgi:hypothetical protein
MDTFPDINDPIVLHDADDRAYQSRVEDVGPGRLTIARPFGLVAEQPVDLGAEFSVGWTSWRGIAFLPAQLIQTRTEGALRLWDLAITGSAWSEQRRDYVRILATGPVTLRPRTEPSAETGTDPESDGVPGSLVDVSEAALCCTVDARATSDVLVVGSDASVAFRLGSEDFDLPGSVILRRPSNRSVSLAELVVRFGETGKAADRLRREIFAQQLGARRR